ncbi:MAG: DUF1800 domain-containing protein [Nocardioides sp.]
MSKPVRLADADRHLLLRFSYGYSRRSARQVRRAGGREWFEKQLEPRSIDDRAGEEIDEWFPSLQFSPRELLQRSDADVTPSYKMLQDFESWTVLKRTLSERQLLEIMVEFWSNLLHVPVQIGGDAPWWIFRISYDRMIRKNALKRFDKMLKKAVTHPAMGLYLDNAFSTKLAVNENLGREVLELHSVGVGKYDERDVKASARMLTGYRVDPFPEAYRRYEPEDHFTGRIKIMDFRHRNAKPDGRKATKKYLRYLAHHPATARRIAHRLCVRFVHDDPSADLVRTVARAYTRNKTRIVPTLRAMIEHPEFDSARTQKVRTPLEDGIATLRSLDPDILRPQGQTDFAQGIFYAFAIYGQAPFDWAAPDGYPERNDAWAGAGRFLNSMRLHKGFVESWRYHHPGIEFKPYTAWLPAKDDVTFKRVCNRISRLLHGTKASKGVRRAVSVRTGIKQSARVGPDVLTEKTVQQIVLTLLDSPNQLTR